MKRKIAIIAVAAIVLSVLAGVLAACTSGFDITVEAENGTVTLSKDKANSGEEITVTVTPNENFVLADGGLKANGKVIENGKFTMPNEAVKVTASFVRKSVNNVNLDNIVDYMKTGNYTSREVVTEKGDGETYESIENTKYTPDACFIEGNRFNEWIWSDNNGGIYKINKDNKTNGVTKYHLDNKSVDEYFVETQLVEDAQQYFKPVEGNKWVIKDAVAYYEAVFDLKYDENDPEALPLLQAMNTLTVEFTNDSIIIKVSITFKYDDSEETTSYSTTISNIGSTMVVIPQDYIDMEVTSNL